MKGNDLVSSSGGMAYTFDDVTLNTGISDVLPAETDVSSHLSPRIILKSPFISAPMSAATGHLVATRMAMFGGLGTIPYSFDTVEEQAHEVELVKNYLASEAFLAEEQQIVEFYPKTRWMLDGANRLMVAAAISTIAADSNTPHRVSLLLGAGVNVLVLDTSHGATKTVCETITWLKSTGCLEMVDLIVGNVSSGPSAKYLAEAGAKVIKVGEGCGASCTTREKTGCGKPQLSAIIEVAEALKGSGCFIIADGGISYPGDVVKALGGGADVVMLGRLIAATDEAPNGEIIEEADGTKWKAYWGMGSDKEREGKTRRYGTKKRLAQGQSGTIEYLGPLHSVLSEYEDGLHYGMGLIGAANLAQLREKADFNLMTGAGFRESRPHHMRVGCS